MFISNRFLSLLLIVAIFFSFFSVFLSLNRLDSLKSTGFVVSDKGMIRLEIDLFLSITSQDGDFIDFGPCKILDYDFVINSEGGEDTLTSCSNFHQSNISVRNDGDALAKITMNSNVVGALRGGSFLDSPSKTSDIKYKVSNIGRLGFEGGCLEGIGPLEYVPILESYVDHSVCDVLDSDYGRINNSVVINFEILVPSDTMVGSSNVDIRFSAQRVIEE